ncbi:MAG: 50S ribosomal protein L30 [Nitrospirae bacterium]|nr:50S ribosomal protein L30 [Nitrospirota bacterium]
MSDLRITLVRSPYGILPRHRRALKSLGLTRIGKSVTLPSNPATRGIVGQLRHLIEVSERHAD